MDSALLGNLVLAIGGGVAGALIFALSAALDGREAGVGMIAAGVLLGAIGLPAGWYGATHLYLLNHRGFGASSPQTPQMVSAEKDLERVLKQYYPDDYAKMRGAVFSFNNGRVRDMAIRLMQRQAPYADDDSMMGVIRIARDETKEAHDKSPKQCAETLSGGGLPSEDDDLKAQAVQVFTHYLEQTATDPRSGREQADTTSLRGRIAKGAMARLPVDEQEAIKNLNFSGGVTHADARGQAAFCDFAIALFDDLSDRSPHESATLMRALIAQSSNR